jgi:predicted phosphodiesterase
MLHPLLKKLLKKPITLLADRLSAAPDTQLVHKALDLLLEKTRLEESDAPNHLKINLENTRLAIISDQHKGCGDAADDFELARPAYQMALQHYLQNDFTLINNGDAEELWENKPAAVINYQKQVLVLENEFHQQGRYLRTFGNHDLEWKYQVPQKQFLQPVFGKELRVFEALLLHLEYQGQNFEIFITHGHQGDRQSDGNKFSSWAVAALWTPLQRYLNINVNTISASYDLANKHNRILYEWSSKQSNLLLITGHTHHPVFASLGKQEQHQYSETVPTYFNSGCCCFEDGDITLLEIENGMIRLVKWGLIEGEIGRKVLVEEGLAALLERIVSRKEAKLLRH